MLRPMANPLKANSSGGASALRKLATGAAIAALVAISGLAIAVWIFSGMAIRPDWYEHRTPEQGLKPVDAEREKFWGKGIRNPRQDFGIAYEDVEFETENGATLRGWWIPGQPGATAGVVTVHGAGADRRDFLRHLPILYAAGYPVLMFDCREHGISDGASRGVSYGVREHKDVSAAARYARDVRGLERVAVIGTSQGGASVLLAAAADPGIDAVVSINPFTDVPTLIAGVAGAMAEGADSAGPLLDWIGWTTAWRVGALDMPTPLDAAGDIAPRPLLLAHGTADQVIHVSHTHALHKAAPSSQLWIAEGATHAALVDTHRAEWRRRIVRFLGRSIGPAVSD
jgi:fermentation-respiration switch protein FrsA (DUF1100 family)